MGGCASELVGRRGWRRRRREVDAGGEQAVEDSLAEFNADVPDRWEKVAALIPSKTIGDVVSHYRDLVDDVGDIEAGRFPCPLYSGAASPSFTLNWERHYEPYFVTSKRSGGRGFDQERKKGVAWTEQEHRNPTQVASHAQKYFIHLNSGSKDKRRWSIHDITTVDLPDNTRPPSPSSQPSTITTPTLSSQFSNVVDSDHLSEVASHPSSNQFGQNHVQNTTSKFKD